MLKNLYKKIDDPYFRFELIIIFTFIVFVAINIKVFKVFEFSTRNLKNKLKYQTNKNQRIEIIDRNGKYLAINKKVYNLYIEPLKIFKIKENISKIDKILSISDKNKIEKLISSIIKFKKEKKNTLIRIATNLDEEKKNELIEEGVFGIYFEESQTRYYPYKNATSHIVGFTSNEKEAIGLSGLEFSFDSYLKYGKNELPLQLSIDIEKQEIIRNIMLENVKKYEAKGAIAILTKVNGEILSAVSIPDFDPNKYQSANDNQLFNRFSLGIYEMGSVCKLFLGAYSNETGEDIHKEYKREEIKIGNFTIHDIDRKEKTGGFMSLFKGIVVSSNVICAKAIQHLGFEGYYSFLEKLGLTSKIDIELPETAKPKLPKKINLINAVTMSYGHGFAISALNLVKGIGAIINNGNQFDLTFLKKNEENEESSNKILSNETSNIIKQIMRETFENKPYPTLYKYDVGGKTGTSIKITESGKYNRDLVNIQLIAAFPINEPQYILFIMLDEPKESLGLRGSNLIPISAKIIDEISIKIKKNEQIY